MRISRLASWAAVLLLAATSAVAQEPFPVADAFAGFSLHNNEYGTDRFTSPGFEGKLGFNLHRNVRLTAGISGHTHGSGIPFNQREVDVDDFLLLFGPEFVLRNQSRVTPFAGAKAGFTSRRFTVETGLFECDFFSGCNEETFTLADDWGAALSVGGGVDVRMGEIWSIRPIQVDYVATHLTFNRPELSPIGDQIPLAEGWQNNVRLSFGVVFHLGERD